MCNLYLSNPGAKIRRTGSRLLVEKDDEIILDTPIHRLTRILIFGRTQITADAMTLLLDRGIAVAMFNIRGNFNGMLINPDCNGVILRHHQHLAIESPEKCLYFAKKIVTAKLCSSVAVLRRYAANHPECDIKNIASDILPITDSIVSADNIDSLRGYEGIVARKYFEALGIIFADGPINFSGRNRRPPQDPINALLSYGYVILTALISGMIQACQLELNLGFYHIGSQRNQPALALDLIEELRHPIVDRFVMLLLHKKCIDLKHFEKVLTTWQLNGTGRKNFFLQWDKWLNTPQALERGSKITPIELIGRQIQRLSDWLTKNIDYQPFILQV